MILLLVSLPCPAFVNLSTKHEAQAHSPSLSSTPPNPLFPPCPTLHCLTHCLTLSYYPTNLINIDSIQLTFSLLFYSSFTRFIFCLFLPIASLLARH
jgi:hypothetical protein